MRIVTIYLRSIKLNEENHLAMFDSNRNGDIDKLTTEVPAGDTVIWKLDSLSGIRSITKIYSKTKERNVFKTDPRKRLLCKGFKLQLTNDAKGTEAYAIEYILYDGKELKTDPMIRVIPPPVRG
jgi:hypothetical protein